VLGSPTLLDGAMGTALQARGLAADALPEEWLLSRPEEIAAVHTAHAAAGAGVLLTCSFNAAAPRLAARMGGARADDLCARAVGLARAAASGALVAGALGPTGLARPGDPSPRRSELGERYDQPARALAAAGADLLWLESQWDVGEARAALAAARRTGLPVAVTFTLRETRAGRFEAPDGTPAEDCLRAVAADGALAAGVNCVSPGPALAALAAWAAVALPVPFAAKPSPGPPGAVLSPSQFAAALAPALRGRAWLAGGCCGATAAHLAALGAALGAALAATTSPR